MIAVSGHALREAGVEPSIIGSEDDLHGAVPLIHSHCYLVKLHGDYLDTRIRNTDVELATYSSAMDRLLDRVLDEHGLIVCGWSGEWDHALRAAIARAPNRRYPTFWAARGAIAPLAADLVAHRAAKVIPISDADAFFEDLSQKVATQADAQWPNPKSAELTANWLSGIWRVPNTEFSFMTCWPRKVAPLQIAFGIRPHSLFLAVVLRRRTTLPECTATKAWSQLQCAYLVL